MARGIVSKIKAWSGDKQLSFTLSTGEQRVITGQFIYERQPIALYKFLRSTGIAQNYFKWPLPTQNEDGSWTPGAWVEPYESSNVDVLRHCRHGLHAFHGEMLDNWTSYGDDLYEVETDGMVAYDRDKWIAGRARLVRKIAWSSKRTWEREVEKQRSIARTAANDQANREWMAAHAAEIEAAKRALDKTLTKLPARLKRLLASTQNHTAAELDRLLCNIREAERMQARAKIILDDVKRGVYIWPGRGGVKIPVPEVTKRHRIQQNHDRKWIMLLYLRDLNLSYPHSAMGLLYPRKNEYGSRDEKAASAENRWLWDRGEAILKATWVEPEPPEIKDEVDRTPFSPTDPALFEFQSGDIF